MNIGIIGAHIVGLRLANEFARVGHTIRIANSRGPDSVRQVLQKADADPRIEPTSMEAVVACELVVLAAPWVKRQEVLNPAHDWGGRILLDASNIYLSYPPDYRVDDLKGDSGSEIIARLAPTSRVVKAFNTLDFGVMFSPVPEGMKRVLFTAGNDSGAVSTVCTLIGEIGFHPAPLGTLEAAGRLMDLEQPLSLLNLFTPSREQH